MKAKVFSLLILFAIFGVTGALADNVLFDWAFYVNGTTYQYTKGDSMPTSEMLTGGLGTLAWNTSTAGQHTFIGFLDHEIDESINGFTNEYGAAVGTPPAGLLWEIDEPGYSFGDIYDHVLAGALDNLNGVPSSAPNDVSMALGWDFNLGVDKIATITLLLSDIAPTSGFYLTQTDPDSQNSIYFSSTAEVKDIGVVPEPGTILLLGTGLAGLFELGRKKSGSRWGVLLLGNS